MRYDMHCRHVISARADKVFLLISYCEMASAVCGVRIMRIGGDGSEGKDADLPARGPWLSSLALRSGSAGGGGSEGTDAGLVLAIHEMARSGSGDDTDLTPLDACGAHTRSDTVAVRV